MPDEPRDAPAAAEEQLLKEFLRQRDVSCPVCGYNLRGSQAVNCPECGATLSLGVGSVDIPIARWVTALLACALPLSLYLVLAVETTTAVLRFGFPSLFHAVAFFFTNGVAIALATGMILLLRRRRAMYKQSAPDQRRIASRCIALGCVAVAGFLVFVFVA